MKEFMGFESTHFEVPVDNLLLMEVADNAQEMFDNLDRFLVGELLALELPLYDKILESPAFDQLGHNTDLFFEDQHL